MVVRGILKAALVIVLATAGVTEAVACTARVPAPPDLRRIMSPGDNVYLVEPREVRLETTQEICDVEGIQATCLGGESAEANRREPRLMSSQFYRDIEYTLRTEGQHFDQIIVFEVQETISGTPVDQLYMEGSLSTFEYREPDFNGHADELFWDESSHPDDRHTLEFVIVGCGAPRPVHAFESGGTYLLFADYLRTYRSAERIYSNEDQWLSYVRHAYAELNSVGYFPDSEFDQIVAVGDDAQVARERSHQGRQALAESVGRVSPQLGRSTE